MSRLDRMGDHLQPRGFAYLPILVPSQGAATGPFSPSPRGRGDSASPAGRCRGSGTGPAFPPPTFDRRGLTTGGARGF